MAIMIFLNIAPLSRVFVERRLEALRQGPVAADEQAQDPDRDAPAP
ncbi:hypothetical protein [Maritimibacter sp. DP1N21-5]|nr:hypothetical protein [Maritimibacter sp. DP1N21-5]